MRVPWLLRSMVPAFSPSSVRKVRMRPSGAPPAGRWRQAAAGRAGSPGSRCSAQARSSSASATLPNRPRKSKKMLARSSASGVGSRTHSAKRLRHSSTERQYSALRAMMPPVQSGNPSSARPSFAACANASRRARTSSRSAEPHANRIALSWSVATVCSRRPSLPTESQHQSRPARSKPGATSANSRSVSASFSAVMVWVSARRPRPAPRGCR